MAQVTFKTIIYIAILLILACFGVGYFLTTPQWSQYSIGKAQLAKVQSDNVQITSDLASVQSFLDDYQTYQKDADTVNLSLPIKSSDMANFAASLGDLAKSSGVVLSNIAIQETPTTAATTVNAIQVIPVSLTASGTFASFKDFMIRLEDHLRIVDVGHVSLKTDENGLIQYQMNLQTYYQK
ncbi:MAG: type 4a pilus biogenesis protein PilO [Candidatus Doudnabacteria bacterium]